MPKQITNKEYQNRLDNIEKTNFKLIGNYISDTHGKITVQCLDCNGVFETHAKDLLKRKSCPLCSKSYKRSLENKYNGNFLDDFKKKIQNNNFIIESEYKGSKKQITLKHKECGMSFQTTPSLFMDNSKCRVCELKRTNINTKMFENRVFELVEDDYTVLSQYKTRNAKVLMRHNKCMHEYLVSPKDFYRGTRCPFCKSSSGEKKIIKFLDKFEIPYTFQKTFDDLIGDYGKPLLYDFYIEKFNLLIEFQGEFHDANNKQANKFVRDRDLRDKYDNMKRDYALNNNIKLLEIQYKDKSIIEKILIENIGIENIVSKDTNNLLNIINNNNNIKRELFYLIDKDYLKSTTVPTVSA